MKVNVYSINGEVKEEIELGNINIDDIDNSYLKITNLKRNLN